MRGMFNCPGKILWQNALLLGLLFQRCSRIDMKDGDTSFDLFFVHLDYLDCLLSLFPCFSGMAEDEKCVGDDIQFLAPLDHMLEIFQIHFFINDVVSDPFRTGFQSKREMKKACPLHLCQQWSLEDIHADITFPIDIQIPFDNEVTDMFRSFGIGVKGVVKKENNLDIVFVFEELNFFDDILRAPHPDGSSPIDRRGAKTAVKRTAAAGHHIDRWEFSLSGHLKNKIVFFKRNKVERRVGETVEILDRHTQRSGLDLVVVSHN